MNEIRFWSPNARKTPVDKLKQVVTAPLSNAWQNVRVSQVLRDDHNKVYSVSKWMLKNPYSLLTRNAEYRSYFASLGFTGFGDASIWVQNSQVRQNKQTTKSKAISSNIPDDVIITERSWFFKRGFIVSNGTLFAMHEIHSSSGQRQGLQAWLIRSNIIETFAVNSKLDIIYFINRRSNSLRQFDLISSHLSTLTSTSSSKGITVITISAHF